MREAQFNFELEISKQIMFATKSHYIRLADHTFLEVVTEPSKLVPEPRDHLNHQRYVLFSQ